MKISITKSFLPTQRQYNKYLSKIWKSGVLTNNGPLLRELEDRLKKYLGVKHVFVVSNGTIALQIAIRTLGLKNEVITTPFSFVATTSSMVWENCKPIFADITSDTLTIDPGEVVKKITSKTTGIIGVHVYGNPCDVEKIQKISKQYNLPVIYDAAHAFGVKYKGKSILNYGDISTLSFHATKLFHTVEGGAIVTNNDELANKIYLMRSFGQETPEKLSEVGINGKNSEFHAAMGLCVLDKVDKIIRKRKELCELYDKLLKGNKGVSRPIIRSGTDYNYSYYPIILPSEEILLNLQQILNKQDILTRRYFYPSLNNLCYVKKQPVLVSEDISRRVLCLPLYYDLNKVDVCTIANIICGTKMV